ncbi:AAA family ATPase [Woeseia oceani]|uniref:AAA family ATPase n=1 Tax=Woeseia oceani TaxID=1548547 RepID=A0A193LGS7_9GAMM|nr:AAA family ATPase [Woeseia oceani]ANO51666.1 AAA family ATPase [Woeseia oceani]
MQRDNTLEKLPLGADARRDAIARARASLATIILGKDDEIALALSALLARGHLLIEDLPGLGKTMLAQALAQVLGLSYQRIQFTSDLLPADIIGVSIYRQNKGEFEFQKGPVFSQLVLADEVNRATPKAQSALLEAMEEQQISVDGKSLALPQPFFVVATQNPSSQIGTFPLPESQLDRFIMRLRLGYPSEEHERELLTGADRRSMLAHVEPAMSPDTLQALQLEASKMHMSDALVDYIQALVRFTRESPEIETGLSPRGALALAAASKAHALIQNHAGVFPDDVQAVFVPVAGHRLKLASGSNYAHAGELGRHVLDSVAIP